MVNAIQSIRTLLKIGLLFTASILGYLLWKNLNSPAILPNDSDLKTEPLTTVSSPNHNPHEVADIADYNEIINRPLFFEDRKRYVYTEPKKTINPLTSKKQPAPKRTNQYSLNGVIITPKKQLAIIQSSGTKGLQRISLGESIDGWIVEIIEPRAVVLKKGSGSKNLELEINPSRARQKIPEQTTKEPAQRTDDIPTHPELTKHPEE